MEKEIKKATDLINKCVKQGLLKEATCIAVMLNADGEEEPKWIWVPKEEAAKDIVKQNAFGVFEAALKEDKTEDLLRKCLEKGILYCEDEKIFATFSPEFENERWETAEEAIRDIVNQDTWVDDDVTYNVKSEEYLKRMIAAKEVCAERFQELYQMIYCGKDYDLIFSYGPDDNVLYYFNPDSVTGGQIVECQFDNEAAQRIANGEEMMDVLAEYRQYLYDINTTHFFDTLSCLIHDRSGDDYIGCDATIRIENLMEKILGKN